MTATTRSSLLRFDSNEMAGSSAVATEKAIAAKANAFRVL